MRRGFSLIEVLFVMVIAGLIAAIGIPSFADYLSRRSLVNARDAFTMTAARARAAAVQRGDVVLLWVRPGGDSVVVSDATRADTLAVLDLRSGETTADLVTAGDLTLCFVPRGFVHPGCGDAAALPYPVAFARGSDTVRATINAVGQVERE